jgi:hypothetical protein
MEIPSSFELSRKRVNEGTVADIKSVEAKSIIAPFFRLRVSRQLGNDTIFDFWWPAVTDQVVAIDALKAVEREVDVSRYVCFSHKRLEIRSLAEIESTRVAFVEIESDDYSLSWRHDRGLTPESQGCLSSTDSSSFMNVLAQRAISETYSSEGQRLDLEYILEDFNGLLRQEIDAMQRECF